MKYRIVSAGLMIVILGWVNPAIAQFRRDRPDFYEEGQQQMEREIERLNKKPPENLLTIQGDGQQWEEFTLMDGGFTVWMPGVPTTQEKQSLETAAGNLDLNGFSTFQASSRFLVAYGDYPQTAKLGNPEAILANLRERILEEMKGFKVKIDRSISLNNSPGKELKLENSGINITFRFYLVKQRLYLLVVQQHPDSRTEDLAKFLDSFRLLPQTSS